MTSISHRDVVRLNRLSFPGSRGPRALEQALAEIIASSDDLSGRVRRLVEEMREEWAALNQRIAGLNREFLERARADEAARRLASIPGIGVLNATALVAAVGDAAVFRRGRDLAAWLGLVPRQHTTGGKPKLLGITKRGNTYLRVLFIHGARAALPWLAQAQTPLGAWLRGLLARAHRKRCGCRPGHFGDVEGVGAKGGRAHLWLD